MKQVGQPPKIIYVFPHPPTIDFSKKFFTTQLQEEFDTEYWDVGPMLGYNMKFFFDLNDKRLKLKKISGLFQLYKNLKEQDRQTAIFIIQITKMLNSLSFYYIFSVLKLKTVTLARGYLPTVSRSQRSLSQYLRGLLRPHQLKIWLFHILYTAITKLIPIRNYEIAFVAGRLAGKINLPQANMLVDLHHSDIDMSIADKPCKNVLPEKYCLFVDDYLPHHPDFAITGSKTISADSYYESMNRFFTKIESVSGMPVVVAAHPKAIYDNNPFDGRLVIFNETNTLIKRSSLVLAHASTAISFVVFHEKPLMLICNDQIRVTHPSLYNSMVGTSNILHCSLIDIDNNVFEDLSAFKVDTKRYNQYKLEYLTQVDVAMESFSILQIYLCNLLNSAVK
jgi:hypothetical protein